MILALVVVASGKAVPVDVIREEMESSNDEVEVVTVVCFVVATGVMSEDETCVDVVGVAGATVGVVAAAGVCEVLLEVVDGGVDDGAADVVAAAAVSDELVLSVVCGG